MFKFTNKKKAPLLNLVEPKQPIPALTDASDRSRNPNTHTTSQENDLLALALAVGVIRARSGEAA